MCEPTLSVWFVCRLCRGSFGQVDAFIEHKKQKHFTQFQNTVSIVFEETEQNLLHPVIVNNGDHQLAEKSNEPRRIKIEVNDDDPIIPSGSQINDEPNLAFVEVKSELITYESEINLDNENNYFDVKQPEQNPYVLLKRLTTEEIQCACVPQHPTTLLPFKQEIIESNLEPRPLSPVVHSSVSAIVKVEASAETQSSSSSVRNIPMEDDFRFECKLCSKQLESGAQLKIHVGICALYHKHRKRFCVICNRKFTQTTYLKYHRVRIHGTEEEKSSLFKFKCHVCPKKYQTATDLRFHLESHGNEKVKPSKLKYFKCSHANCVTEFGHNSSLQRHISIVHLGARPFSCSFPNCNKTFTHRGHMDKHIRTHTGERPFKCTVDNCDKAFSTSDRRSRHHRTVHRDLLSE